MAKLHTLASLNETRIRSSPSSTELVMRTASILVTIPCDDSLGVNIYDARLGVSLHHGLKIINVKVKSVYSFRSV